MQTMNEFDEQMTGCFEQSVKILKEKRAAVKKGEEAQGVLDAYEYAFRRAYGFLIQ